MNKFDKLVKAVRKKALTRYGHQENCLRFQVVARTRTGDTNDVDHFGACNCLRGYIKDLKAAPEYKQTKTDIACREARVRVSRMSLAERQVLTTMGMKIVREGKPT